MELPSMKFSSKESSSTIGVLRAVRGPIFFIVVGIFLLGIGVLMFMTNAQYDDYLPVESYITDITYEDKVFVEYEVNGKTYEVQLNSYSSSYRVGDEIDLYYDPANPQDALTKPGFVFTYGLGGAGIIVIIVSIVTLVQNTRKRKALNAAADGSYDPSAYDADDKYANYDEATGEFVESKKRKKAGPLKNFKSVSEVFDGFEPDTEDGEYNEYYFYFYGKANQGHLMETPDRRHVFEAALTKFSLAGDSDYDFIDYVNNKTTHHEVGKTVTTNDDSWGASSGFSLDDCNIYEILKGSGYNVDTDMSVMGIRMQFDIKFHDTKIGEIHSAGTAIMPNVKSNKFTENMHAHGLYKIYCKESNIPVMFLYAMYIARSEQTVYD